MADHPFWQFSLDRYGRSGVPALCLSLQDSYGADVNLVLFALWLGADGYALNPADAQSCAAKVQDWHHCVVVPIRGVRRWLKGRGIDDVEARDRLRATVQKWEIEAERMEQKMLFDLTLDGTLHLARDTNLIAERMMSNVAAVCPAQADLVTQLVALCR